MIYFFKRYLKHISISFCIILILTAGIIYNYKFNNISTTSDVKLSDIKEEKLINEEKIETIFVDVKGAVNAPGVYEIDDGKRIIDAINLAGGLSDKADTVNLNLSKKIEDEMYIIVYTKEEIYNYKKSNEKNNNQVVCASVECDCPDITNDACIKSENNILNELSRKISINEASKEELMKISGIGESKANSIINYRNENGAFKNIEDIKNVSGIGESLYDKIKDQIIL